MPAFEGWNLQGEKVSISSLIGKRLLLVVFNPETPEGAAAAKGANALAPLAGDHNFQILGVGTAIPRNSIERFVREEKIAYPVLDDSSSNIAARLGLPAISRRAGRPVPALIFRVDAEGNIAGVLGNFLPSDPQAGVERELRNQLRLPAAEGAEAADAGPLAPDFTTSRLDGDEPFTFSSLKGRPVVLIFFLHTCPHCHRALNFLKEELPRIPEAARPELIGISVQDRVYAVRQRLKDEGLDFFTVLRDPDDALQRQYGVLGAIPVTFLIDANGAIVSRTDGWREDRDPALTRMRLASISKQPVPMLLHQTGFSGNEFCSVCHTAETETWELTRHASAFDTLVEHGADTDTKCVGCHVVGFEKKGGYEIHPPTPHFEDVGCESCHGRGGPHLSPGFVSKESYESACVACHDAKHSLAFEYTSFLGRVSHGANAYLLNLPAEERDKLLAERGVRRTSVLPTNAAYVGSDACQACHAKEFETWSNNPHANAVATLDKKGEAGNAACLQCHTTGFGLEGGFPEDAAPAAHPDLARVGCESCHGPGGAHVGADAKRVGTIVSLGDKCDSCAVLKICGACHDDANDPGFEFEVMDKIEKLRHGTIEPAAGLPDKSAAGKRAAHRWLAHGPSAPNELALLEHAFAVSEGS